MQYPQEILVANRLVTTYGSARRRKKDFNLSIKYLSNILAQTHCAYSGEEFDTTDAGRLTLERFNNDLGYIEGNVIPVKNKYNMIRSDHTLENLISLRDSTSGRIIRAADARTTLKEFDGVLPKYSAQYENILNNIKRREDHLFKNPNLEKEVRTSLLARIAGGYTELERLRKISLKKVVSVAAATTKKPTAAEQKVHDYDTIIKGLTRFENLSRLEKAKVKKGLPLSASMFQLIRGKM